MAKRDQNDPVTKAMLDEAVDAILKGMDKMAGSLRSEMNSRFEGVNGRLDKLETEVSHVKDEINGLKGELSDTPSRREFNELKARVDKYHPVS